jgi:hypothetical protein
MQTLAVETDAAFPHGAGLHDETDSLEALHRAFLEQAAAWRSAHDAAFGNTKAMLARIDALIAGLERL